MCVLVSVSVGASVVLVYNRKVQWHFKCSDEECHKPVVVVFVAVDVATIFLAFVNVCWRFSSLSCKFF